MNSVSAVNEAYHRKLCERLCATAWGSGFVFFASVVRSSLLIQLHKRGYDVTHRMGWRLGTALRDKYSEWQTRHLEAIISHIVFEVLASVKVTGLHTEEQFLL